MGEVLAKGLLPPPWKLQGPDSQGKAEAASEAGVAWRPQPDGPPYGAGPVLAGGNGRETFFWGKGEAWKLLFSESLWLRRPHRSAGWGDNQLSIAYFQGSGQFCSSRETVLPGTGTLQERKGLLSGIIMKKKGKDLYFFFGSFILGLILNLQKSCGNGIEFPYVFRSASHDTIILCGHGTFIKANPIMLLTSVQSLFKFYQFFTNVFFSVSGSIKGSTLHFIVISPQFHSICGLFSVFVFHDLDLLEEHWSIIL